MPLTQTTTHALFVAWQDPESRRYYPVARLVANTGPNHDLYEFAYTGGANTAANYGFEAFQSFPDINKVYRSEELFPLLANRLMSKSRPDYSGYVSQLGLDPENTDPMLILARSGGVRATDSLELFPYPTPHTEKGCYETYFLSHGLRYLPEDSRDRVSHLKKEDRLYIMADFQNPVDRNALMLRTEDRINVGYLPRYFLGDAWQLVDDCSEIEVLVAQVNPEPAPLQQRLLCRLESCWPDDFEPFKQSVYEPLSEDATQI